MRGGVECVRLAAANLASRPVRTALELGTLSVAFAVFVLLGSVAHYFSGSQDRPLLYVQAKRLGYVFPLTLIDTIRAVPGVQAASQLEWLGAFYRDQFDPVTAFAVDPAAYVAALGLELEPAALRCLDDSKNGAWVSGAAAARFGWNSGGRLTLESTYQRTRAGDHSWDFLVCGVYDDAEYAADLLFRYDYLNDYSPGVSSTVSAAVVRTAMGFDPPRVAEALDREFAGTSYPTRTTTFDEQRRHYARLLGNVNLIVAAIVGAVFFSALAMLGVSNVRSIDDAGREIAVLRVMGFPFHWIACVFLAETAILLAAGVALGVAAVAVSGTWVASLFPMDVGVFSMSWLAASGAVALAATCAGCFGVSSFRAVSKVRIVRGLGGAW